MSDLELARWYFSNAISHASEPEDVWDSALDVVNDRYCAFMIRRRAGRVREATGSVSVNDERGIALSVLDMARDMLSLIFPRSERPKFNVSEHIKQHNYWKAKLRQL